MNSILDTIKIMMGPSIEDDSFDTEIILFINEAFMRLTMIMQNAPMFSITDNTKTWDDYTVPTKCLEGVKTYVFYKVKLNLTPPSTSFGIQALNESISSLEWNLTSLSEMEENQNGIIP